MKTTSHRRAMLAVLTVSIFLSSCALPPREAWHVIRHDGFFTFLAFEFGNQPLPPSLSTPLRSSTAARKSQPPVTVPWRASTNRYWNSNPNSPVVGMTKESPPPPSAPIASATKPIQRPLPLKPATTEPPAPVTATPANKPAAPPRPAATAAAVKPELQIKPEPKVTPPPPASAQAPAPSPAPAPIKKTEPPAPTPSIASKVDELPFGDVIPGRPGFVHSPYAMKTQIVDVTGLRPGQEVKCPFTGKLFRVPPGEQASTKPADEKK